MKKSKCKKRSWHDYPDAAALSRVKVRLINQAEVKKWNELVNKHHYLNSCLVGPQLRYVAELDDQWVVLASFGQAAIHLEDRDNYIGWSDVQRGRRLKFIGQNNRLVVLSDPHQYPNLVSRVMKLIVRRVSQDWENYQGHPLFGLETFVDREYFQGTCYKASGWTLLGKNKGHGRARREYYQKHNRPKELYFRTLNRRKMRLLLKDELPEPYRVFETGYKMCSYSGKNLRSLFDSFARIPDPRSRLGRRYPLQTLLTIIAMATAAGMKGHRAIASYASYLTPTQRRILRCPKDKKTNKYRAPGETCIREILYKITPQEIEEVLCEWMQRMDPKKHSNIALDGKTVKGTAKRDKDGNKIDQLHLVMACTHEGRMIMQEAVDKKENEIVAVRRILERMPPLHGATITGDAMNTQQDISCTIVQKKGGTISGG